MSFSYQISLSTNHTWHYQVNCIHNVCFKYWLLDIYFRYKNFRLTLDKQHEQLKHVKICATTKYDGSSALILMMCASCIFNYPFDVVIRSYHNVGNFSWQSLCLLQKTTLYEVTVHYEIIYTIICIILPLQHIAFSAM